MNANVQILSSLMMNDLKIALLWGTVYVETVN